MIVACLCQKLSLRSGYETISPKLYAVRLTGRVGLVPYTVDRDNRKTVCHCMSTLGDYPRIELTGFFIVRIVASQPMAVG